MFLLTLFLFITYIHFFFIKNKQYKNKMLQIVIIIVLISFCSKINYILVFISKYLSSHFYKKKLVREQKVRDDSSTDASYFLL